MPAKMLLMRQSGYLPRSCGSAKHAPPCRAAQRFRRAVQQCRRGFAASAQPRRPYAMSVSERRFNAARRPSMPSPCCRCAARRAAPIAKRRAVRQINDSRERATRRVYMRRARHAAIADAAARRHAPASAASRRRFHAHSRRRRRASRRRRQRACWQRSAASMR